MKMSAFHLLLLLLSWMDDGPSLPGVRAHSSSLVSASSSPSLNLTSTTPSLMGAPILFTAVLLDPPEGTRKFVFQWADNLSPAHWEEKDTERPAMNLTLNYPGTQYQPGSYKMNVAVYDNSGFFRRKLAVASTEFVLSRKLAGAILVRNVTRGSESGEDVLAADSPVELGVHIHDPTRFLANSTAKAYWMVNGTNYGVTGGDFNLTFPPGKTDVEATVLVYPPSDFSPPEKGSEIVHTALPSHVKYGVFRRRFLARDPVKNVTIKGDTWLKHGQLLDLTVSCDGSGPWEYCWSIHTQGYNVTGNETCVNPQPLVSLCEFPTVWYFRQAGIFDVLVIIRNGVTSLRHVVHVNIYKTPRPEGMAYTGPLIVLLVVSTFLGVGCTYFFVLTRDSGFEVANFDFQAEMREEEEDREREVKTFFQRLRESMMEVLSNAATRGEDTVSHVSSVSSRSAQNSAAGTGIHYGSIS